MSIDNYNNKEISSNIYDNIYHKNNNYFIDKLLKEYSNIANYNDNDARKNSRNFFKKISIKDKARMFMWIEGRDEMQNNDFIYKSIRENNEYELTPDQQMELTNIYLRNKEIFKEKFKEKGKLFLEQNLDEGWGGGKKRKRRTRQKKRKTKQTKRRK
jgi:hypothetical protein